MNTRLLKEHEQLLFKQQIKSTKKVSKERLGQYYQQQRNSKWLGVPFLLWLYQTGKKRLDEVAIQQEIVQIEESFDQQIAVAVEEQKIQRLQKRRDKKINRRKRLLQEGNLFMRWGEPPVIYSPQLTVLTEQNFLRYLQSKGYFDAQVSSEVKSRDKKVIVTYQVEENQPYRIGELRLNTPDKAVEKLLKDHQQQSLLKKGNYYDQEVLRQERERIYELLSNHGYFSFNRQYVRFEIDTTAINKAVVIETVVDTPSTGKPHPIFHINQVEVSVDADQAGEDAKEHVCTYDGITFRVWDQQFSPASLAKKIPLHPPQLYSKEDMLETQRRLSSLNMFKYVNITHDTLEEDKLITHIHTSFLDRYQVANELGLQVSHWLTRPFYKLTLKSRDLFGRLETLALATNLGLEGVSAITDKQGFVSSRALGIDLSLSWPQFLLPLKDKTQAYLGRFDPVTKLSLGYHSTQRPGYTQGTLKSYISYAWQGLGSGAYEVVPFQLDLIDTKEISPKFQERLDELKKQGNSLHRTFKPSWVSHLSFQAIFFEKPKSLTDLSYSFLEIFFESGGTLQNFLDLRKLAKRLAYYQYVKFRIGYSQHIPVYASTLFAYCFNAGIANPYGENKFLPYDRYYFAGSSNGIRAWSPRSLGPGTYAPPQKDDRKSHLEQPGELLLQGSGELRQQLIGFFEGALFVDVGNVWMLHDDSRPGGKFSFQGFYKTIAIGTGLGLRLNSEFFVLRFDVGLKVYDPSRPVGQRFIGKKIAFNRHLGLPDQAVFNIGIGYPF